VLSLCPKQLCFVNTCVIFNPTARGEKAKRFRQHLDQIGANSRLKLTTAPVDARRLAREAVEEGFDTVVAAGGDGTVNEVLNGIGDVPDGFKHSRLGVLPLGTVNVFARELAIPSSISKAWRCVEQGREIEIDLPCGQTSNNGSAETKYFAQLAGAGLDARAVELVAWQLKKRIGPLAYVVAGVRALFGPPARITVTADQETLTGGLVLIGNGQLYGGSYKIFPQADLRDGLLDVCVFPRVDWRVLARCAPGLLTTGRLPASAVRLVQAKSITLTAPERTPAEIDGELFGVLPARFYLSPNRLRVVVP
jgi:YegS/Rv2252/BmrU family lipid kinase